MGLRATKENLNYFEKQKKIYKENKLMLIRHAGKNEQLYGSVTARDISEIITSNGFPIHRSQIILEKSIKTIGTHNILISLHPEIETNVKLHIARSEEEAELLTNVTTE